MIAHNKFLDANFDMTGYRTAMQSYPRSGNTFLRRNLEQVCGIFTGADMPIAGTFHEAMMGFLG